MKFKTALLFSVLISASVLTACQDSVTLPQVGKATQPLPAKIIEKMKAKNMDKYSPILVRIFKEEGILEVWKEQRTGKYDLIASYDICKWSGKLGPKFMEGDRQAPEGFYKVTPAQMNPNSSYYLSFNIGFPNAYDRVNGRTGQHLMVHGACSSSGCYSMSDENVAQIYAFGRDSFKGGQREFQIQAFPFRMTAANMARYKNDPNFAFWKMLKEGYDIFEVTKKPPQVDVCEKRYVFNRVGNMTPAGACPPASSTELTAAYSEYQKKYDDTFASALNKKSKPPAPSIVSVEEARLVADWSRKRAAGQKVSREPPSLSPSSAERENAPDIQSAAVKSSLPDTQTTSVTPIPSSPPSAAEGAVDTGQSEKPTKKSLWKIFGG